MTRPIFDGYGLMVIETEAGSLRFMGTADVDAGGVEALTEALRKWRSSSVARAHFDRRAKLPAVESSEK